MKVILPPLLLLLSLIVGVKAYAQTKVYASTLVSSSHTTNVGNSVDGNENTRSIITSNSGILLGLGSYDGYVEVQFPTTVPANQTFYVRIKTEDNVLDALLGGTLGDVLSGVVGGLVAGSQNFTVSVKNNTTEVMSLYSGFLANFSGDTGKLVTDVDGHYYLAITPAVAYNRVRITNNLNALLGFGNERTLELWDVYYVSEPDLCNDPKFTSYDVTGLSLDLLQLSNVTANNERAIDGDMNTSSTLSFGVLAIATTAIQRAHFESPSIVGEEFGIRFGTTNNMLSLNLFSNLRIKGLKGSTVIYNQSLQDVITQRDRDSLNNFGKTTFYFTPNASVDKISFEYTSIIGLNVAQQIDIYEFIKRPSSPTLVANGSTTTVCEGTPITVLATTIIPNATIYYYSDLTSTTPIAQAPAGQAVTFGSFFSSTSIYAASGYPGCPFQSNRTEIPITVTPGPLATDLSISNLLPVYCAEDTISLHPVSASSGVTRWHLTNNFDQIINPSSTVNSVRYFLSSNGMDLNIYGATMLNNPVTVYLSVRDAVSQCWSAPGSLLPVVVNLQDEAAPVLNTAFPPTCLIENTSLADITTSPSTVIWYATENSHVELAPTTILQPNQSYYAATRGTICVSSQRLAFEPTILDQPSPTTLSGTQFFCTADLATLADLQISGSNIQWYDQNNILLDPTTLVEDGTTYNASSTGANCESATRLAITTTISDLPTPTTINQTQYFCPQNNPTVADINVTSANVGWFLNPIGGVQLPDQTPLNNGTTYYGAILSATCASSIRLPIEVFIETVPAATTSDVVQIFCAPFENETPLSISDLSVNPTNVNWYLAMNSQTPLALNTPLVNNTTYYAASQGAHCESTDRILVHAIINSPSIPTTAITDQVFCSSSIPLIRDIVVTQSQVVWYDSPRGNLLDRMTSMTNNTTYYGYIENQGCLSPTPLLVNIAFEIVTPPTFTTGTQFFCPQPSYLGPITIDQLNTEGMAIQWFIDNTDTTPLPPDMPLISGNTYYAAKVGTSCNSTLRTPIYVVIESIAKPIAPESTQIFCGTTNPTLADISISPVTVHWFDSEFGGNLLNINDPLENDTYYYAAGSNGNCESGDREAVLVSYEIVTPIQTNASIQFFCPSPADEDVLSIQDIVIDTTGFAIQNIEVIWYDAPRGGNIIPSTTPLQNNRTYYVGKRQGLCHSEERTSILVFIDGIGNPNSVNIPQNFCNVIAPTVANLQMLNPNVNWYNTAIDGVPLTTATTLINGETYYAELFNASCTSPSRLAVTVDVEIVQPTTINNSVQIFCPPTVGASGPTLADVNVDNQNIVWYTSNSGGTILPNTTPLTNNTMYFASLAGNLCNSPERAAVLVQIPVPHSPTTPQANQHFCASSTPLVSQLITNQSGVTWYLDPSYQTIAAPTDLLVAGHTYFGTLTDVNGCHSTIPLQVTATFDISQNPSAMSGVQVFCNSTTNTLADIDVQGVNMEWHSTPLGGSILPHNTPLTTATTYYGFTSSGTCLSQSAAAIYVMMEEIPSPTGNTIQNFCSSTAPTIGDLHTNENGTIWYSHMSGGLQLDRNILLSTGGTYYCELQSQHCSSTSRMAVTVNIENVSTPTTTENTQIFCGTNHTLADLSITGTNVTWYTSATGNSPLSSTDLLQTNTLYFAANSGSFCESSNRLAIYVILEDLAPPLVTSNTQVFCANNTPTLAEISITPSNVIWKDVNNNIIIHSTPLIDGATYYAFSQGINCLSNLSTAVTVEVNNPNNGFITADNPTPCFADTVTYRTHNGLSHYNWTVNGGTILNGGTTTSDYVTVVWNDLTASLNLSYLTAGNCLISIPSVIQIAYSNCSDLSITKTSNTDIAFVGDIVQFTIVVNNIGSGTQSNILVSEIIRDGFNYVSHTTTHGNYTPTNGEWHISSMEGNTNAILTIHAEVIDGGDHRNMAYIIQSDIKDPNTANDSVMINIQVECLVVYNEISPNGDGKNDYFYIDCLTEYPSNELSVFNRYGNLVYQTTDYKNDWDGYSNTGGVISKKDLLPSGTYFYKLNVDNKGVNLDKTGWIYIVR